MLREQLMCAALVRAVCVSTLLGALGLAALGIAPAAALAQEEEAEAEQSSKLDTAMGELADEIASFFEAEGMNQAVIGPFQGTPGTSAGPRIEKALTDKLGERVKAVKTGQCGITGRYMGMPDEGSGKFMVRIESIICDKFGREMRKLTSHIVTSETEGLAFMGATVDVSDKATPEERAEAIEESITNPSVAITGPGGSSGGPGAVIPGGPAGGLHIVRAAPDSPYGVQIGLKVAGGKFVPLPVVDEGGQAIVDIKQGQSYAIRLINDSPFKAGATVTIDGVSVFAVSKNPAFRQLDKWVVMEKNVGMVNGWHVGFDPRKKADFFHDFQVVTFGESVAARFASVDKIGTITVQFCAAYNGSPPPGEPDGDLIDRGDLATGLGPVFTQKVSTIPLEFGAPRSAVTIRYAKPDLSDAPPP